MIGDQDIYLELFNERINQEEKWGVQNHPIIWEQTPAGVDLARAGFDHMAVVYKKLNDNEEPMDWAGILLEEVYEALAESDPVKIRAELVQVAAVAIAAIESLDRNGAQ